MQLPKLKIGFFIAIIFVSCHLYAQNKPEHAIRELLGKQEKAWNQGDINAFMEGYWKSDSLLFVGSKGPVYGWEGAKKRYEEAYPSKAIMGKLSFTLIRFKAMGEQHYQVLGKFHLSRAVGDAEGFFTLIFQQIDGKWLIISDHTS